MSEPALLGPVSLTVNFSPELVVQMDSGTSKPEALRQLIATLANAGRVDPEHEDALVEILLARERAATTAMGKGLAFPHLRSTLVAGFCGAIGVAPHGIDFDSLDRVPTRLILLTLSPFEARAKHSEILGRLCSLLSDHTLQYSLQTPRPAEELLTFLGLNG